MNNEKHQNILRNYIRAKDDNKAHLMPRVFADSKSVIGSMPELELLDPIRHYLFQS